jgi:hypothetical protein
VFGDGMGKSGGFSGYFLEGLGFVGVVIQMGCVYTIPFNKTKQNKTKQNKTKQNKAYLYIY